MKTATTTCLETESMIDQFFRDLADSMEPPVRIQTGEKRAGTPGLATDLVREIAVRAESLAGYHAKRHGWMPWFRRIVRSDADLARTLVRTAQKWPALERLIFEFYFVDSLDLADIGQITGCRAGEFHNYLGSLQRRLREEVILDALKASR